MNLLFVCSKNSGRIAPFILEQGESLVQLGIRVEYFTIEGKGWKGYLKNRKRLVETIKTFQPQVIHAHYGLSGLLANMQRRVPVVTTYHGSDINNPKVFLFSKLCMMLSVHNIFVSIKNQTKSALSKNFSLIPCGVDINLFVPFEKLQARKELGLDMNKKYVLFAGAFNNNVKNPELALSAVAEIKDVELLELKGYTRQQVVLLMNAVDAVLMTSFTEGSPQFIKEAMACNCPVVSVPVGDVPDVVSEVEGCYITTYEPADVAEKLRMALDFGKRTEGRKRIIELKLDIESVAKKIVEVYRK
jgi:glycosyltransferase involved in cell wall biosynthesis